MSYNLIPTSNFAKELKKLAKKYPSLKNDLAQLGKEILENPTVGTAIGNQCYKIRLAIKSKGKGKSGGARVITYVVTEDQEVYLLSIYDKSEQDNISDKKIEELLKGLQ